MEQGTNNTPPVAPVQQNTPTPTPAPATSGGNGVMNTILIFLGLGLVVGLIMFLMRKSGSSGSGMFGMQKAQGDSKNPPTPQQAQTIVYNTTPTFSNVQGNTSAVVTWHNSLAPNANLLRIQKFINEWFDAKLVEDGVLGQNTVNAMLTHYKHPESQRVAREINSTKLITEKQMNFLLELERNSRASHGTTSNATSTSITDKDFLNTLRNTSDRKLLIDYITKKLNWTIWFPARWSTEALRSWSIALYNNKNEFEARDSGTSDKGVYNALTGYKIRN